MASEYDVPSLTRPASPESVARFARVREEFQRAAAPYLASPWGWLAWGLVMPVAALVTQAAGQVLGFRGIALLWSFAILLAGGVEAWALRRAGAGGSPFASWALTVQGNLSLVGLALSLMLLLRNNTVYLPGLWLLLLGHSFFSLGGLSYPALRRFGLAYQVGGLAALIVSSDALLIFAATTGLANLGLVVAVVRRGARRN